MLQRKKGRKKKGFFSLRHSYIYDLVAQSMSQGISFFLPDFQGTQKEGLRLIVEKHLSPSVLGRSAFCERMLANEKRLGCSQYVIFASGEDSKESQTNQTLAAGAGEQMKARYSQDEMAKLLEASGFLIYEHLDHGEMTTQYFTNYNTVNPDHLMEAPRGVSYVLVVRRL